MIPPSFQPHSPDSLSGFVLPAFPGFLTLSSLLGRHGLFSLAFLETSSIYLSVKFGFAAADKPLLGLTRFSAFKASKNKWCSQSCNVHNYGRPTAKGNSHVLIDLIWIG